VQIPGDLGQLKGPAAFWPCSGRAGNVAIALETDEPDSAAATRGGAALPRFDLAILAVCALVPALSAGLGTATGAPASHDAPVVRVLGLGWTGALRGLDAMVASPAMLVPIGTRAMRAGVASAIVVGLVGALAFLSARALAHAVRPLAAAPRLLSAAAGVAVLTALLGPSWQTEGAAPGGAVVGAAIVVAAFALGATGATGLRAMGLVLGLAASYEPLVFAGALAAVAPRLSSLASGGRAKGAKGAGAPAKGELVDAALAFALGLLPLAFAAGLARRSPDLAIPGVSAFASKWGEGAASFASGAAGAAGVTGAGARATGTAGSAGASIAAFATAEIGVVILAAAAIGGVLAWLVPRARPMLASLLGVVLVGVVAVAFGAPVSASRVAAPVLAASCAVHVIAAVALAGIVAAIARARVPFAEASAAMVVVLELVLPARAADEAFTRREGRAPRAAAVWTETAWAGAPPAALVLVSDPGTMGRIVAARAVGEMRSDLVVVPSFAIPSRQADRALAAEPKLAPLYRDIALGATPEELSLTTLAAHRPLLAEFDPRWDRSLSRHFVPVGLTQRFEAEPRGASERRRALDLFTAAKERLVRVSVARKDADLAAATASMLRARAIAMAATGERDLLARALDDLRPFAPDDPVASALVRRTVTSKGPIEVRDLK